MAIPSQSKMFNRVCGYTLGRDYRSKSSLLKWLKIGDAQLQIENLNNKKIRVQKLIELDKAVVHVISLVSFL